MLGILWGGLSACAVVVTGIIAKQKKSKKKTGAIKSKTWAQEVKPNSSTTEIVPQSAPPAKGSRSHWRPRRRRCRRKPSVPANYDQEPIPIGAGHSGENGLILKPSVACHMFQAVDEDGESSSDNSINSHGSQHHQNSDRSNSNRRTTRNCNNNPSGASSMSTFSLSAVLASYMATAYLNPMIQARGRAIPMLLSVNPYPASIRGTILDHLMRVHLNEG